MSTHAMMAERGLISASSATDPPPAPAVDHVQRALALRLSRERELACQLQREELMDRASKPHHETIRGLDCRAVQALTVYTSYLRKCRGDYSAVP